MAELIREYIKRQLKDKEMRDKRNSGEEKRFTITLSEYDYLRLAYIAKKLGLKRSTLSRNILLEALMEAEDVMGLQEFEKDLNGANMMDLYTDYGIYINGISTDGDEDDSEDNDSEDDSDKKTTSPVKKSGPVIRPRPRPKSSE